MMDIESIRKLMAGGLPPIEVAELKRACQLFPGLTESRAISAAQMHQDDISPAAFVRCALLNELLSRGILPTNDIFDAVANKPFSSTYTVDALVKELNLSGT